ncbi:hypothetical protein B0H19DRAFT_1063285 [Mycena capillaripes]|nr:hypothetical protein B0H19DRAFT_1063285 [Mycena capillaripes]
MTGKRGRKAKPKRNLTGLRNHKGQAEHSIPLDPSPTATEPSHGHQDNDKSDNDSEWDVRLCTEDGMKSVPASDIGSDMDIDGDEDHDYCLDSVFLDDEVFLERLLTQAADVDDSDADEEEWVPTRVCYQRQRRREEKKARGSYKKGPDMASKSDRTKTRYKDEIAAQQSLTDFGFSAMAKPKQSLPQPENVDPSDDAGNDGDAEGADEDIDMISVCSGHSARSVASFMSVDGEPTADDLASSRPVSPADEEEQVDEEGIHEWELEAEFDTLIFKAVAERKDWETLREQIKQELKKKGKSLSLAKINQLTIIRNFATLCLKGFGWMAASREIARQWHEGEGNHFSRQMAEYERCMTQYILQDGKLVAIPPKLADGEK